MSRNHKIAESLEDLVKLVNAAVTCNELTKNNVDLAWKANHAISFLVNLFLCSKCQGSGEVFEGVCPQSSQAIISECPDCQGTGIKTDILDRLEAEDITDEYHKQGCTNGTRQG